MGETENAVEYRVSLHALYKKGSTVWRKERASQLKWELNQMSKRAKTHSNESYIDEKD